MMPCSSVKDYLGNGEMLRSLKKSFQDSLTNQLFNIEGISLDIDERINGINSQSKTAQCHRYSDSIETLQSKIADMSIEKQRMEAKESEYQLSLLKNEKMTKERMKEEFRKTCEELLEKCCNLDEEKALVASKLKNTYTALSVLIKVYKKVLPGTIKFETKDVFKYQFNTKRTVYFKMKKESDSLDSWKLIEIHPQLKCQRDIMERFEKTQDFQGLYCLLHVLSESVR